MRFVVLGDRLVVGRRVLAPLARVRVLLPQPNFILQSHRRSHEVDADTAPILQRADKKLE